MCVFLFGLYLHLYLQSSVNNILDIGFTRFESWLQKQCRIPIIIWARRTQQLLRYIQLNNISLRMRVPTPRTGLTLRRLLSTSRLLRMLIFFGRPSRIFTDRLVLNSCMSLSLSLLIYPCLFLLLFAGFYVDDDGILIPR